MYSEDELKDIEKVADSDLLDYDETQDLTGNIILFGRRLWYKIFGVLLIIVPLFLFAPSESKVYVLATLFAPLIQKENYYVVSLADTHIQEKSEYSKSNSNTTYIVLKTKKGETVKIPTYNNEDIFPIKKFHKFNTNKKVYDDTGNKKRHKITSLKNDEIILKMHEPNYEAGNTIITTHSRKIQEIYANDSVSFDYGK